MSIIEKAAIATDAIQDHVGTALEALQHGFNSRIVNGKRVYIDPSKCHLDLLNARKAINEALSVMNATKWPTNADYDLEENA